MSTHLRLYHPAAVTDNSTMPMADALENLQGKVVGFIDNAKPNFQYLVEDLETQLKARYGIKAVKKHRKPGQVPVKPDVLKQFVEECDAVITGSGD